jgi:RNA polymerase sigma-70 factor (ECF subfamily)
VLSDSELVDRARGGDVESFGALIGRYERNVLAVALTELRDIHAAEDAAQDALLLAFQRLATLNDGSRFGAWLIQIARRQAVESGRKRRLLVVPGDELSERDATDAPPQDRVDREHLLTLVGGLPDHERVLIGLRFFDGHDLAAIAEITGRPIGTVTKQLSRAMARLRALLEKEDGQ